MVYNSEKDCLNLMREVLEFRKRRAISTSLSLLSHPDEKFIVFHVFILLNIFDFPSKVFLLLDLVFVFAAASSSRNILTFHFSDEVIGHLIFLAVQDSSIGDIVTH